MAISESVGIRVTGDSSSLVRALDAAERGVSKFSGALSKTLGTLNDFSQKAAVAIGSFQKAMDLARFAGEMRQLEKAAGLTADQMRRLSAATDGTVSKANIMRLATRGMNSDLRLTTVEMETVLRAADNLGDKGFGSTAEIADRLLLALNGNTRGLKELGIQVDVTKGKQVGFNDVMAKFEEIASSGVAEDSLNKQFEQFETRVQNATDAIRTLIGEISGRLMVALGDVLESLDIIADKDSDETIRQRIINKDRNLRAQQKKAGAKASRLGPAAEKMLEDAFAMEAVNEEQVAIERYNIRQSESGVTAGNRALDRTVALLREEEKRNRALDRTVALLREEEKLRGGGGFSVGESGTAGLRLTGGTAFDAMEAERSRQTMGALGDLGGGIGGALSSALGGVGAAGRGAGAFSEGTEEGSLARRQQQLEEFMSKLQDSGSAIGAIYQTINTASMAMIDAIIEGNGNILRSVRKAVAGQMKASALQNFARAIEYTSVGIFTSNPQMFVAAAKAAAAGAAYMAGAALLGAGGGGGGGGGGGAGAAGGGFIRPGGGAGSGDGSMNITINFTGDVSDPEKAAEKVQRAIATAKRTGRGRQSQAISIGG